MTKCIHTEGEWLKQYVLNELNEEPEIAFQEHLFSCEECRAKVDAIWRLAEALHLERTVEEI
jgi:anti-sigma factor RsiW